MMRQSAIPPLLLLTVAFLAMSACGTNNPAPATSTPTPEPAPAQPATVAMRVSVFNQGESTNARTEVWLRGHGSWYPDLSFGGDVRNFPGQAVGSEVELFFYPLGRADQQTADMPEIVVNVPVTASLATDRNMVRLELWDDRFEVWGGSVESQVIQRN